MIFGICVGRLGGDSVATTAGGGRQAVSILLASRSHAVAGAAELCSRLATRDSRSAIFALRLMVVSSSFFSVAASCSSSFGTVTEVGEVLLLGLGERDEGLARRDIIASDCLVCDGAANSSRRQTSSFHNFRLAHSAQNRALVVWASLDLLYNRAT